MVSVNEIIITFRIPLFVIVGMILFFLLSFLGLPLLATSVIILAIGIGTFDMVKETIISLTKKQFALDYIAIVAIVVALCTQQYIVGAILALMISTGTTLEAYAVSQAKKSLTGLIERIPTDVTLWTNNAPGEKEKREKVKVGTAIFIRKGEVVPLDGTLLSSSGDIDESSLTGEPYVVTKRNGDLIRSGTSNSGEAIAISVTKTDEQSTYRNIITMVKQAQEEKSPLIRLADKYSTIFTLITFTIAAFSYVISNFDLSRVLAVLAVATPCPLIIATPIALLGGVNKAAKHNIIVKKLAALEILPTIHTMVFDKTGTITLGIPKLHTITSEDKNYTTTQLLRIAEAIERNSLHPLAKAIVTKAHEENVSSLIATNSKEIPGVGISAEVENKQYTIQKASQEQETGIQISMLHKNKVIGTFHFSDEIKPDSKKSIHTLIQQGLIIKMLTGDKKKAAEHIASQIHPGIQVHAECSPEEKQLEIRTLKQEGKKTAMIGDGINDAPALALADVGMAFSNEDQTIASETADIVFLGGDFSRVIKTLEIAKRTISIATQSIQWGIGLSIIAMCFSAVGFIPPLFGAGLQEAIDVAVIINALRASR